MTILPISIHEGERGECSGDIPWDFIRERWDLPHLAWLAPENHNVRKLQQYVDTIKGKGRHLNYDKIAGITRAVPVHLEEVVLANGLRYVRIISQSGKESYNDNQIHTEVECFCGKEHHKTDIYGGAESVAHALLRDGYILDGIVAQGPFDQRLGFSDSLLSKKVTVQKPQVGQVEHCWKTKVGHIGNKFFGADYLCKANGEQMNIFLKTDYNDETNNWYPTISYDIQLVDRNGNLQQYHFDHQGKFDSLRVRQKYVPLAQGGSGEISWKLEKEPRDLYLKRDDLKKEPDVSIARSFISKFLGVNYGDELMIDRRATLDSLIMNIDSKNPQLPLSCVCFIGATKSQPASSASLMETPFDTKLLK